jgi:hypothetical protein
VLQVVILQGTNRIREPDTMKSKLAFSILTALGSLIAVAQAQIVLDKTIPVTVENFNRAESDLYFSAIVKKDGFGKFEFTRTPSLIEAQTVVRMNRDTLYGAAVFDLDAGPVTIALPDAGKRFISMQLINEDQYSPAVYYSGTHILTREQIGTRYVLVANRILVDPNNPKDIQAGVALQDAIKVSQQSSGKFEVPNWDPISQKKVRDALIVLSTTLADSKRMFGSREQVDPVRFLVGSAALWGGNPEKDATYLNFTPAKNDGTTIHKLTVGSVPVDGFWSISLYNAQGYFEPNTYNAYTINNLTAQKAADGSVAVQFGGCDGKIPNCLPIMKGWNYTVRLYRPQAEILNGAWKFPEPQAIN